MVAACYRLRESEREREREEGAANVMKKEIAGDRCAFQGYLVLINTVGYALIFFFGGGGLLA